MMNATTKSAKSKLPAWKCHGGFTAGVVLAVSGLALGLTAAASYMLRAAGANLPAETAMAVALRCAGGAALVIFGFAVMVLCSRGVDAAEPGESAPSDRSAELAAIIAEDDLLCRHCGAANDYLARFCDQCGKRL